MAQRLEESFEEFNIEHSLRSDNHFVDALATLELKVRFKGATTVVTIMKRPIPAIQMLKKSSLINRWNRQTGSLPLKKHY